MSAFEEVQESLRGRPCTWLVTGAAGFIGSHLVATLLRMGQVVRGLDNFSTGRRSNLVELESELSSEEWSRFTMTEGDLRDMDCCREVCGGVDRILHQGAIGSVPRSVENPVESHESNVNGTLNLLVAARDAGVRRFVYASSSSVYGDNTELPAREERLGRLLSPYAATKMMDELYAGVFARTYDMEPVGLRYFNVFGPRQDPEGAYAAVIPKWISAMLRGEEIFINGDGETSRDFCYVKNVVQANVLAATSGNEEAPGEVFNVAMHHRTSLNDLFNTLKRLLQARDASLEVGPPTYREFRAGDVRHSLADVSKAQRVLGYEPTHDVDLGLEEAIEWYCNDLT